VSWCATAARSTPGRSSTDTSGIRGTCPLRRGFSNASRAPADGRRRTPRTSTR
jgi:hypothetical protein